MTDRTPDPDPTPQPVPDPVPAPTTQQLDQAVIDAGRALAEAQRATPRDRDAIDAARATLLEARAARWSDA